MSDKKSDKETIFVTCVCRIIHSIKIGPSGTFTSFKCQVPFDPKHGCGKYFTIKID